MSVPLKGQNREEKLKKTLILSFTSLGVFVEGPVAEVEKEIKLLELEKFLEPGESWALPSYGNYGKLAILRKNCEIDNLIMRRGFVVENLQDGLIKQISRKNGIWHCKVVGRTGEEVERETDILQILLWKDRRHALEIATWITDTYHDANFKLGSSNRFLAQLLRRGYVIKEK